jgi:hypothetical protein
VPDSIAVTDVYSGAHLFSFVAPVEPYIEAEPLTVVLRYGDYTVSSLYTVIAFDKIAGRLVVVLEAVHVNGTQTYKRIDGDV